ncbi:cytochrome c oxidase accessory protein CcoG [Colwellia sp. 39_35_sub15_T18]|nr:cytochrome c oxidase accessory protein CcoG [Colwellia sp. 39_35_sub15_T18]
MKFDIKEEHLIIKPYKSHESIYVREQNGRYQEIRRVLSWLLIIAFIAIPFLQYHGQQAVLLNVVNQQFRFFAITFWPQDFILLASLLMVAAFALFFVTSWLGRVWCGYVCPQTVWTLAYIWVEHRIEGTRNQRIALDKQANSFNKLQKKLTKHFLWLLMSAVSATTFISYFIPTTVLYSDIVAFNCSGIVSFWLCFFTVCTYGNAGWLREKVCIDMCPYARFQAAMFDKNTLLVAYDKTRGEGRGARKIKDDAKQLGLGDCVDCNLCVEVCPTGIDIRNGMQYECINCGLCVDACDDTMARFNYQKGLISYTSEQQLLGGKPQQANVKVIAYGIFTVAISIATSYWISSRVPLETSILRDRNALYRTNYLGLVENTYTLKILNKTQQALHYQISVTGLEGASLTLPKDLKIAAGVMREIPATLSVNDYNLTQRVTDINFTIQAIEQPDITLQKMTKFYSDITMDSDNKYVNMKTDIRKYKE